MKRLIILNPASRNGMAGRLFEQQADDWRKRLGSFELYQTKAAGDCTAKVKAVLESREFDQILVAGGDGSINEASRGYWSDGGLIETEIPLGIINLGTGGDLYRSVREGSDDYLEALVANRSRRVDVAQVSHLDGRTHPFMNIASVGMAGEMLRRLKASKFQAGALAYFYHTLRTLVAYEPKVARLEMTGRDGTVVKREVELLNFFVCNGRYSGGGMQWAPTAVLDSGVLEVTLIGGRRKLPLVLQSRKVYSGEIESFPGAETFEAKEILVIPKKPMSMEADGEVIDGVDDQSGGVRFSILEKSLPLVL